MKEKVLYTCEVCRTDYANKAEAKRCEESHKRKLKIVVEIFDASAGHEWFSDRHYGPVGGWSPSHIQEMRRVME